MGPTPLAAGCFIVVSVFVSWTLNQKTRRRDSLTNDSIAALTLPGVATGHLIYQLIYYPGDRSSNLTTQDLEFIPVVAGIEASLNICETFAGIAVALFVIPAFQLHLRRCISVLLIGLSCFEVECALFTLSPKSNIAQTNLGRPFVLNQEGLMIAAQVTIAMLVLLLARAAT